MGDSNEPGGLVIAASSSRSVAGLRSAITFLLVALVPGCEDDPPRPSDDPTRTERTTPVAADSILTGLVISANGIGLGMRGATVGDVRAALPSARRLGDVDEQFMVDLSAIPEWRNAIRSTT